MEKVEFVENQLLKIYLMEILQTRVQSNVYEQTDKLNELLEDDYILAKAKFIKSCRIEILFSKSSKHSPKLIEEWNLLL